jgi:transglutaminase-like putative cysteine protease
MHMSRIQLGSELSYDVRDSTVFLFKIAVASTGHQQIVHEKLAFDPMIGVEDCQVGVDGNRLQRAVVEPCQLKILYEAVVELAPAVDRPAELAELTASQLPSEVLTYMNPSRYCESDLLARFAYEEFGRLARGFSRVEAICEWVFSHLEYTPGSTTGTTTAADVLLQRTGVCRDFAHLAIALCRGVGIPARYVSGYAVDLQPPDFHGFMEAFLDGDWYLFDPTRLASTLGLVRIGIGRDAADVAFATVTGQAMMKAKSVWASFEGSTPQTTETPAVSTA